jgi:predicted transcriptional regulator of viral defense system
MSSVGRYSELQTLGRPVLTTGEAAVAWDTSLSTAARQLSRLAASGLIVKIVHGVWQINRATPDPAVVLPVLTDPYPSYISGWTALSRHGMIEQIPRGVFAVSLDRAKSVETTFERYEIHHIHPYLFGGFEGATGIRAGVATAEKALFDTVYLFSTLKGTVTLPELELPDTFDRGVIQSWIGRVPSARLRTLAAKNLDRLLETDLNDLNSFRQAGP